MRFATAALYTFTLLLAMPNAVEAKPFQVGDRVLVTGRFARKCSARVESLPALDFAQLKFDRAGCGDAAQPVALQTLQHITFIEPAKNAKMKIGDQVVTNGLLGGQCGGTVKEISKSGYVSLDFDSTLCADAASLHRLSALTRVHYVPESHLQEQKFVVGQKIMTQGIHEQDQCAGVIAKLTDNGLASIQFEALTCANHSRLYSLQDLRPVIATRPPARTTGAVIFQRVMREIASAKKNKKQAKL